MVEKNTCQVCGNGEYCGACGTKSNYMLNNAIRWILAIIIISWVFCAGVMYGELKAQLGNTYGYGKHMMLRASPMGWTSVSGSAGENVTFTTASVPGAVQVIEN